MDVTPDPSSQPVLDRLYSRAIVIANGDTSAALITVDTIAINDGLWHTVTERLEKELGIPARNVFITATHTHSGGGRGPAGPGAAGAPGGRGGPGAAAVPGAAGPADGRGPAGPNPVREKIFTSVKMAKDKLQPARMGYGTGVSYLNVNRQITANPSDVTVYAISFNAPAIMRLLRAEEQRQGRGGGPARGCACALRTELPDVSRPRPCGPG